MKSASKFKYVIIDEDYNGTAFLKEYFQSLPKLSLPESFSDPGSAGRIIKNKQKVAYSFMNINMEISGIEIARILRDHVLIVFATGHRRYALDALSVNADRYLVKPISFQNFVKR